MKFENKQIQEQLIKAEWKEGRNIKNKISFNYEDTPEFIKDFLHEFAELKIDRVPHPSLKGEAELLIFSEMDEEDLEGDNTYPYYQSIIGKKLYPLGLYIPDGYYICCDADGRVYMIGEYCYCRGKNLYEGIENILLGWENCFQLDEKTGKWWNEDAEYVELPPL